MNVLIVGATRGIGLGFVQHFIQDSSIQNLFATYRTTETAEALTMLQQANKALQLIQWDVTCEQDFTTGVEQIQQTVETLDLVIYCAGVLHQADLSPEKSLRQITSAGLNQYFQINSIGGILLAKHVQPLLKKNKNRNVLAFISAKVGSIEDNQLGGWYGYRASKAALNMLIKTTSIEYSRRCPQTLVLSLHPGTTDTDLSKPFQRNVPPGKLFPVERTVRQLVDVINGAEKSGQFFSWDGSTIPW